MEEAGRELRDAAQLFEAHRDGMVLVAVVAELSITAAAPGPHAAIGFAREAVRVARRDLDDAGEARDLYRSRTQGGRAIARLSQRVVAPSPDASVRAQRDG